MTALPPIVRVVTGHDADGKAVLAEVGTPPHVAQIAAIPGTVFHEIWATEGAPVLVGNTPDPTLGPLSLGPPAKGTRIRIVDIPPDTDEFLAHGASKMHDAFSQIGDAAASTVAEDSPHPLMHRTQSVDYGVVLAGECTLVLDRGEVVLRPGHVVVQRGTNHAWANRSGAVCRMLFVLVDGVYDPSIAPGAM
ncbi:MAG: cupin domain-containing protein [Paracoccaceae bacterium]